MLHVVYEKSLEEYAKLLATYKDVSCGHQLKDDAKAHLFIPYYSLTAKFKEKLYSMGSKKFVYFTYKEEHQDLNHKKAQWDFANNVADGRIAMSQRYSLILNEPKITIPLPPLKSQVGDLKQKPIVIGVSTKKSISTLKSIYPYVDFIYNDNLQPQDFYNLLDFYLVVSSVEGGPISLLEAKMVGIPTIGPRKVGWCEQYCDYKYEKGDLASLIHVLNKLLKPRRSKTIITETQWASSVIETINQWL